MAQHSHITESSDLVANHRLISFTPHDPVSPNRLKDGKLVKNRAFFATFSLELFFVVSVAFLPLSAHAGVFSFITDIFTQTVDAATPARSNLQTMTLLQAAVNPDPNPAKGGGDITIVGGSALLPEAGPIGTIADVGGEEGSGAISVYVVHKGDTLSEIAQMFGVTVNTIVWSNDLVGGVIHEGDKLLILPISGVSHTVKKGDTIQSIAKKYKADAREIAQFNSLSESAPLVVGQIVIVPDGEVAAPAPSSSRVAVNPTAKLHGAGGPDYGSFYIRPVIGGVRTQGLHGYNAVDLADAYGTPIIAAAAGLIIISRDTGWNGGYGHYVVIQHANNTQTLYGHLDTNLVVEGQYVSRGQTIGLMGSTGKATGPHLHFEVRGARNPF